MELSKENFMNLYWNEKLSTTEIGKIYGFSSGKVWKLLKNYNIPIRTRSEAPNKGCFKKGYTPWMKGRYHSKKTIKKIRESKSGKKNASYGKYGEESNLWRGGTSWNYARAVWERYWNESLPKGYCIHHVDRNRRNNKISNLALVTRSTHSKIHQTHYNLPHIQRPFTEARVEVKE